MGPHYILYIIYIIYGCCSKLEVLFVGVLVIRTLLFGVDIRAPDFLKLPYQTRAHTSKHPPKQKEKRLRAQVRGPRRRAFLAVGPTSQSGSSIPLNYGIHLTVCLKVLKCGPQSRGPQECSRHVIGTYLGPHVPTVPLNFLGFGIPHKSK